LPGWHRPVPLDEEHVLDGFSCGKEVLDDWLLKRAGPNQVSGATRTFVVEADGRVVGYYALASGSVTRAELTGRARRNMPDPVPVVILARFAIDAEHQGQGLGAALLRDALARTKQASASVGIACLIVHAKDDDARNFYLHYEFEPSPTDDLHLILLLKDVP
jgi:GNAT superfamily N-acetyltransferase